MNDVFERLRDIPEPPLRPSSEALTAARRDTGRRTALRAAAGAFATLAIVGIAAVAADRFGPAAPRQEAAAVASPSTTPAGVPTPQAPAAEAVQMHSTNIARALIDAVPTGYQAASVRLNSDDHQPDVYTVHVSIPKGGYRAITVVRVSAERGAGVVAAVYGTDLPAPGAGADLCAAHQDLGIEGATITACWTASVGGTPVRLVSGIDPGVGDVMTATRYLRGGYVVVSASQGMRAYRVSPAGETWIWDVAVNPRHEKALAELPFTADRLSTLAMDPTLIP